jgi:hypothetical protein
MILVTKRQVSAFLFLWEATEHGTKPWTGIVRVEGMAQENVGDCLGNLRRKGALDWQMTIPRTYRVLVKLEDLSVQERKVCQAVGGGDSSEFRGNIRDSGAFMEAVNRARLKPPAELKLKRGTLYTKGRPDPNARTL